MVNLFMGSITSKVWESLLYTTLNCNRWSGCGSDFFQLWEIVFKSTQGWSGYAWQGFSYGSNCRLLQQQNSSATQRMGSWIKFLSSDSHCIWLQRTGHACHWDFIEMQNVVNWW